MGWMKEALAPRCGSWVVTVVSTPPAIQRSYVMHIETIEEYEILGWYGGEWEVVHTVSDASEARAVLRELNRG